jgi:hypothetical protein
MGIEKGQRFADADVFVDYSFEQVMYRWDHIAKKIYVRLYGEDEKSSPVPHDGRLFNDALLYGEEISREVYERGMARP